MKCKTPITAVVALLIGLLCTHATAGSLDPALVTAIEGMAGGDKIAVIIRCTDPLDAQGLQAREQIPALKNKAAACERSLRNKLANTAVDQPKALWIINGIAATVPVAALNGLVHRAGVDRVYLNREVRLPPRPILAGQPGNPGYTFWNLSETRITDLWALGYYGLGVVVGTMDTGVDLDHLDVGPNWRGGTNSWFDPNGEHATPYDADGHGTEVMGIILGGNSLGVDIGAAPGAQWIAAKIFDDAGLSDIAKIHEGFQWMLDPDGDPATDDAPDILNNSWVLAVPDLCDTEFASDMAVLRASGIAVVFSAGNFGPSAGSSLAPANNSGTLSVGAVDYYEDVLYASSRGPSACGGGIYPSLVAPGENIFTTGLTGGGANPSAYAYASGTSIAAPHVAGAMAVLKGAVPAATPAELEGAIQSGAFDLGALGPDNDSGAGYLDAVESYYLLTGGAPVDTDGDGVSDALDQCPGTPPGEAVNASGCAASQLDADGDGVSDAVDLCPGTPLGEPVDADGCPLGLVDADGDGFTADVDCNDADASVHPGAAEVHGDGIDQDCNGLDLTITIARARYVSGQDKLVVWAGSDYGSAAGLRMTVALDGGGSLDRALSWNNAKGRWQKTLKPFAGRFGAVPVSVTVYGAEGSVTGTVEMR